MSICLAALSFFSAHHPAPSTSLSLHIICVSHLEQFLIVSYLNFSRDFCSRLLTLFARRSSFRPRPLMNLVLDSRATAWALDITSTHKPTTRHSNPHHTSTQHFVHCDNFLLQHFGHVTFFLLWHSDCVTIFYCDTATMWHFSIVTFWLCDNFLLWHVDHVTFFYCDILTLWQFSTVTFRLKVDGLSVHPKMWTFCHTVNSDTVILSNPWLWHFVHFGFWFFPSIPCPSCIWFWQMTISWHCPFNFLASTHWFGRLRSDRGFAKRVFFYYFSDPTARLEAAATFSSFSRGDFDHCDILSTPCETSRKASRRSLETCDKTSTFCFIAKVDVLSQSR